VARRAIRRVLMTGDAVGGVWTYAVALAAGLSRHDIEVDLAVMGPPPDQAQLGVAARIPGLVVHTWPFKLEWMDGAADDVERSGRWLLALEAERRHDLVHLNGYAHAALPFDAPKVVVAHSCVLSWWRAVHGAPAPADWDAYAAAVTRGLAAADHVIAPSAAMLAALDAHYGPRAARASVVPNGLPPVAPPRVPKRPLIFSAGRLWDAGKNVAALVAAAPEVPWPIWLAGDTAPDAPGAATPTTDRISHLGWLAPAQMAEAYDVAAIYALPARYEPFGLTVLEAAQRGCALVLGDIPSLRENWEGAARFVGPDDVPALAGALRDLAADAPARTALARAARRRAARFSARAVCAATLAIYGPLAERRALAREATNRCAS
jgi:glycosyltransferase involved in cell wall biosynthesis